MWLLFFAVPGDDPLDVGAFLLEEPDVHLVVVGIDGLDGQLAHRDLATRPSSQTGPSDS